MRFIGHIILVKPLDGCHWSFNISSARVILNFFQRKSEDTAPWYCIHTLGYWTYKYNGAKNFQHGLFDRACWTFFVAQCCCFRCLEFLLHLILSPVLTVPLYALLKISEAVIWIRSYRQNSRGFSAPHKAVRYLGRVVRRCDRKRAVCTSNKSKLILQHDTYRT